MNRSPHVLDELSAYLDGESECADQVARHLQSCPDCARRHVELLKISGHVKALESVEVHPAFVTRVMAHVEETQPAHRWLPRLSMRLVAALCGTILVAAASWRWAPPTSTPVDVRPEAQRVNLAWQDDAMVVEALSRLMDAGLPVDVFGSLDDSMDADVPNVALDTVIESLADSSSGEEFVDPFTQDDLLDVMDALAGDDVQLLNNLLEIHGNEV